MDDQHENGVRIQHRDRVLKTLGATLGSTVEFGSHFVSTDFVAYFGILVNGEHVPNVLIRVTDFYDRGTSEGWSMWWAGYLDAQGSGWLGQRLHQYGQPTAGQIGR